MWKVEGVTRFYWLNANRDTKKPRTPKDIIYVAEEGDTYRSLINQFPEDWEADVLDSIEYGTKTGRFFGKIGEIFGLHIEADLDRELEPGSRVNLNLAFDSHLPGIRKLLKIQRNAEEAIPRHQALHVRKKRYLQTVLVPHSGYLASLKRREICTLVTLHYTISYILN